VTSTVSWTGPRFTTLRKLRAPDPPGAIVIAQAVSALAEDQQPTGSAQLGSTNFRRLRVGAYRVVAPVPSSTSSGRAANSRISLRLIG
jgi:mRNA interferase RelE/StbE